MAYPIRSEFALALFCPLQSCLPLDFANAMQQLGERACYVKIGGTGRNALDFHLAFYLGELVQQDPGGLSRRMAASIH